ncbi:MAG: hypothetical protein J7484_12780 [Microbacterium sp.]|nr:hypothetical protein [Microbacterium sp.]
MAMSFEEFCSALWRADTRGALGIGLTDDEAQQVLADPATAQNWYAYWLSTNPEVVAPPAPAAPVVDPYAATAPYPGSEQFPTAPYPGAEQHPTMPYPAEQFAGAAPTSAAAASAYPGAMQPAAAGGYAPTASAPATKRTGLWVTLSILGALLLIVVIVVVAAFATARHWTKTDVPEQQETFHSEDYKTGRYDVTMDATSPCWVDQGWTDCINLLVAQYNGACADVTLTEDASTLCTSYLAEIDRMKSEGDGGDYVVVTVGGFGSLHRTEEMATRQVSNNDHRDAVTHEAVCYLGFLGECS